MPSGLQYIYIINKYIECDLPVSVSVIDYFKKEVKLFFSTSLLRRYIYIYILLFIGAALHCGCVSDEGEMCVGQPDAVYFYTTEDRSVCFGFEGEKKYMSFFKHYLLVAHEDPRGIRD
jgi:hypothetical protein